jgi:hypothetical protein
VKEATSRFQSCVVLAASPTGRRLWQFDIAKNRAKPTGDLQIDPGKPLPKRLRTRDWQALFQPCLRVAWMPTEGVFVRAVQLPSGDPAELQALVEFQLDRISPLPLNQITWTAFGVTHPDGRQQTALVIVASRNAVEEFLNRQSEDGFVVQQLDLPLVRAWKSLQPTGDGLWLLFETTGDRRHCLSGWFIGGIWRDVSLLAVGTGQGAGPALVSQLGQTAWAGEMEGWANGVPPVHVSADEALVSELEPALSAWSGQPVVRQVPASIPVLALSSAVTYLTPPPASLVPEDWTSLQREKSVDRLWLRGLGAIGVAYVVFLFLFLITLNVRKYQRDELRSTVGSMGLSYTNSLQLKAQVGVLQEQVALRFAALDAWRSAVELLPPSATLQQLDFQKGRTLSLRGTVSPDATADITKFNSELKKSQVAGQPLFANVKAAQFTTKPGAPATDWSFDAELRRSETP